MIVSGTIYSPDGRAPLEGINLFVYHTDATGRYSTTGGDNRNTRIHGLMRTNSEGRYEFRTIKPRSYPATRIPAHIHAFVSGPGYPEYWIDDSMDHLNLVKLSCESCTSCLNYLVVKRKIEEKGSDRREKSMEGYTLAGGCFGVSVRGSAILQAGPDKSGDGSVARAPVARASKSTGCFHNRSFVRRLPLKQNPLAVVQQRRASVMVCDRSCKRGAQESEFFRVGAVYEA